MDPEIWGPHAWVFLHSITITYPENPTEQDKINYKNFFNSLHNVLPCPGCAYHYQLHLKKHPLNNNILSNKKKLIIWLITIHNEVNKINNKKEINYNQFMKIYHNKYTYNNNYENIVNRLIFSIPVFFVVLLISIFLFSLKTSNQKKILI